MIIYYLIGALVLLLLSILVGLLIAYSIAYRRTPNGKIGVELDYSDKVSFVADLTKNMKNAPYEEVSVLSYDGLTLYGRFYERKKGAPTVLFFHGYRGEIVRDGCGIFRLSEEMGCNILHVHERSHGKSEGRSITFGVKESRDVKTWCEFLKDRTDTIYLGGISMGASTVLLASKEELPCVKGIVADCGFSSPAEIIYSVLDRRMKWLFFLTDWSASLFCKFSVHTSVTDTVKESKYPILFIHGENDTFVPMEMTLKNYEACNSTKRLELFPNAEHGMSYIVDPERYHEIVKDFLTSL